MPICRPPFVEYRFSAHSVNCTISVDQFQ
jgi:hypothetical protein